tara:strand:- start:684 stop:920 length:237 start_codon:yes stop_codon:yes gene_type:complete
MSGRDDDLLRAALNAQAMLVGVYQWVDRIEKAGGATSIEGISACHAMLKSLRANASRVDKLVTVPLEAAIAARKGGAS